MTWLVEHCADLLNKYSVGKDGRTAYERIKSKRYGGEMIEFGRNGSKTATMDKLRTMARLRSRQHDLSMRGKAVGTRRISYVHTRATSAV